MNYIRIAGRDIQLVEAEGSMRRLFKGDERHVEGYRLALTHDEAVNLFDEGVNFSLVQDDGNGGECVIDKSEFTLPCGVLDNLDGTMTVYMGKYTDLEIVLMEVLK
jgi:hypothetical protein